MRPIRNHRLTERCLATTALFTMLTACANATPASHTPTTGDQNATGPYTSTEEAVTVKDFNRLPTLEKAKTDMAAVYHEVVAALNAKLAPITLKDSADPGQRSACFADQVLSGLESYSFPGAYSSAPAPQARWDEIHSATAAILKKHGFTNEAISDDRPGSHSVTFFATAGNTFYLSEGVRAFDVRYNVGCRRVESASLRPAGTGSPSSTPAS